MRKVFLKIIISTSALYAGSMMAQDYPVFYDTETGDANVPVIPFPSTPTACAEDDETCIDTYLDPLASYLEGNMNAQRPPSPVYSWKDNECVLGNEKDEIDQCNEMQQQWEAWNDRAVTGSLDFVQGADQTGLVCDEAYYNPWTLRYVYKCQDIK